MRCSISCVVVCLLLVDCSLVTAATSPGDESAKAEKELVAAIEAAKQGGAKKVAVLRLKRALDKAEKTKVSDSVLQDAKDILQGSSKADQRLRAARSELESATQARDLSRLENALKDAKALGITKGAEVSAADGVLQELKKDRKKSEREGAKRKQTWDDLRAFNSAASTDIDITAFTKRIADGKVLLSKGHGGDAEERILLSAEEKLKDAKWQALPQAKRLDIASLRFGKDMCQPPEAPRLMGACAHLSDADLVKRSTAVGEQNCEHPTLKPGGPEAPLPNSISADTAKSFCKYPPPFDLREAEDGQGYRATAFDFPTKLFNASKLKEEMFSELAVMNLDMEMFRQNIIPCAAGKELWVIEFYVHWCAHCMAMMPTFYKLGVALRASGAKMRAGAVNCATHKELCGAFQVIGHPVVGFFYGSVGPSGQVQLFEYNGQDVRINAALDSFKANRNPQWDAGAPEGITPPKHLFPGEAIMDLVRLLPEEYRPADPVLRWLADKSKVKATSCPDPRQWYAAGATEEDAKSHPKKFLGNGWPSSDHIAKPINRLQDAAQAIVYTLEEWVMPHPASESPHGFAYAEIADLHAWVSLLADAFPDSTEGGPNLRPELVQLRNKLRSTLSQVEEANGQMALCLNQWQDLLRSLRNAFEKDRSEHNRPVLCRTETCRIWSLLHTLSVSGMARARGGSKLEPVANNIALNSTTQFLRRYFSCNNCRQHFVEQVEANAYDLTAVRDGKSADLALWWWRLHNAVSIRVAKEGKCKTDRGWPSADVCTKCWHGNSGTLAKNVTDVAGLADIDSILTELERAYWPLQADEADVTTANQ